MDIYDIRRANFKAIVDAEKAQGRTQAMVADRVGFNAPAAVSQLTTGAKSIGDVRARAIERAYGLASGWMDREHGAAAAGESAARTPGRSATPEEEWFLDLYRSLGNAGRADVRDYLRGIMRRELSRTRSEASPYAPTFNPPATEDGSPDADAADQEPPEGSRRRIAAGGGGGT